ncbi:DUF4926 domain-containing protein [Acidithiobacillus sp.]|uniref:DUF4926 domain-containing protein n=1 Tax=Acidithiobacillus sp. TaxID=1872118 RepID=UPI003443A250
MIQELDTVILVKNHPDQGLVKGDMGTVVMVHDAGIRFSLSRRRRMTTRRLCYHPASWRVSSRPSQPCPAFAQSRRVNTRCNRRLTRGD